MMQFSGRYCFFLLIFFIYSLPPTGYAQQLRYAFKNYTPNDGLPSSEVHKVLEDARHYMWFATDHGVCRFNGYEFKTYNLADNSILGLYEDYKKRIWAWSFSGRLFVLENEKFEEYKWNGKIVNTIQPGVIQALHLANDNSLYISVSGPHTIRIFPDGKIEDLLTIEAKAVFEFIETTEGDLFGYVSSYPGKFNIFGRLPQVGTKLIFKFSNRNFSIESTDLFLPERFKAIRLPKDEILFYSYNCLIKVKSNGTYTVRKTDYNIYSVKKIDNSYYYATDKGLFIEDGNGKLLAQYFEGAHIVSIEKDYEGGLWFTSITKAVYYLNSSRVSHVAKNNIPLDKKITTLYPLKDSSVLIGTSEDEVMRFKPYQSLLEARLFMRPIYSFYEDSTLGMLVGGPFNSSVKVEWYNLNFIHKLGLRFCLVPGMTNFAKQNENIFIGLSDNIIRVDPFKQTADLAAKESFRVSKLFVDRKGQLLVGNIFGLWKYVDGKLERYDSHNKIFETRITDIAEDANRFLCLGTRGKGMLMLVGNSVQEVNEENGLISNNVRKIYIDDQLIWVATNKGVSIVEIKSVNPFKYKITHLSVQDGLLSNEINDIERSNGQMIIATNSGVSYLDRRYYAEKNKSELAFYVTGVQVNGIDRDVEVLKEIGFRKRNVSVRFEALKYNNPGKINYRYRLKGYDNAWFYTKDLQVQFNPMPYGIYELEVQAKGEREDWTEASDSVLLKVVCNAPFWATIWFWIVVVALIIFFLLMGFRKRIQLLSQRQKEEKELQQRITESEQLALKSQMNPHFIFNSLNSIQQYVIDRDVKGANSFISGFSKLMRQTLDFSSKEKITLTEEIGYLKNYLELERMRMESKFDFTITVNAASPASELRLPPLMLQPYVENALRHGVRYLKNKNGHIQLSFIERDAILECIIEDNGIGRDKAGKLKAINPIEYQSRGMSLTAERVELLNRNTERKILIVVKDLTNENAEACGTSVSVKFPV